MKKEKCNSIKLEILLRDLLKKSFLFPKFISVSEIYDNDTTITYYLRLINLTMEKDDFYVYPSSSENNDSVKLIQTDTMMTTGRDVGVKILEINEDTTKIKIAIGLGAHKIASTEGVYNYELNADSCTWILKDSTFWQY